MPKTILIVDDDDSQRAIFSDALQGRGYEVLLARHGAEGVHLARRHRPDLVLMDISMPVMDGWEAIEYLKSDPSVSHIPVWAISGYMSEEELESRPGWLHLDRVVEKPVDPGVLSAEVEARIG